MIARLSFATAVCFTLTLAACEKKEEPAPEPATETEQAEPEPVAEAEETPEPAEAAEPTAANVPIPEDFAEQVATEVTQDNYKDQLAAMEKDLAE